MSNDKKQENVKNKSEKKSLKTQLLQAFLVTSIIPIILVNLFLYKNTSKIVNDNASDWIHENLKQTRSSLEVWLESYEDILFQVYTDDNVVELIDKINQGEDVSVCKNQLRRMLHGFFYTKDYIKSISVVTANGTLVFYDLITGSSTKNSWIDDFDLTREELYQEISANNATHVFSTQKAIEFGADTYYLFHLGHRIIDYRNVGKDLGIVIVSVDEELLNYVCSNEEETETTYHFIVDEKGEVVSFPNQELLCEKVIEWSDDETIRQQRYEEWLHEKDDSKTVNFVYSEKFKWDIVNVSSQKATIQRLHSQQRVMVTVLGVALGAAAIMIWILIQRLAGSMQNMVSVMQKAGKGELRSRVKIEENMSGEMETIAMEFNHMLERLSRSLENEREANTRQREAEIAALEAQINPHFLYNLLDTINWMAIDREEYEISNSISALAYILRYGIDNSNGIVSVREECEWLKKYLFLQQTRLKYAFQCEMHMEPEVMECKIHKLLLQPFVENAILHGFEGVERTYFLSLSMKKEESGIHIEIYDNGKGIPKELVEQMNRGFFPKTEEKNHIGMENAMTRIHMYYGDEGKVQIDSKYGEWTKIFIKIPLGTEKNRG